MVCVTVKVVEKPQPKFYITNVRTDKTSYYTDETIRLTGRVVNSGNADGYATINVTVDDRVVKTDRVYVRAGYYQDVSYTIEPLSARSHKLCIELA